MIEQDFSVVPQALFFAMLATLNRQEQRIIEDIYLEHCHALLKFAMLLTNSQHTAEDAVGNAFVKVIEHKEKIFSLNCSEIRPYLVTIVRRCVIDTFRDNAKIHDIANDT
jgi:DNA-directed RNA polymerase specialized sigma24 family protein